MPMKGVSGYRWQQIRKRILAQSRICGICGLDGADSVDHIVPRSQGGAIYDETNLRPAHFICNARRGAGRNLKPRPKAFPTSRRW